MIRNRITRALLAMSVLTLGATMCPASVAEAKAEFAFKDYEGRIEKDPFTFYGFDVIKINGKRYVTRTKVMIGYHCTNGAMAYTDNGIPGKFRVKANGRFSGKRTVEDGVETIRWEVNGRLGKKGKASGTVEFHSHDPVGDCYSGAVDWRSKRGADHEPEPQ